MADEETTPTASITNIYYDCLERIFDLLDLEILLNVANTCKRLQIAAAAKFGDEYGTKRIFFRPENRSWLEYRSYIYIAGLKFQLPFLRCFGSKISHLEFYPDSSNEHKIIVEQYINQYCADTLTSLTIHEKFAFLGQKPFKNLENLVIRSSDLSAEFSNFVNWYPNLRHLALWDVDIRKDSIAVNLPHLEHLGISMSQHTTESIADLLNANLQLQSLDIRVNDFDTITTDLFMFLHMIRSHRLILKIKIKFYIIARVTAAELTQLANEHPSITELNLHRYELEADNAIAFIGQLKSLKNFEFCVRSESECNRIRDQLNGDWYCEYQLIECLIAVTVSHETHVVKLNRKLKTDANQKGKQKVEK